MRILNLAAMVLAAVVASSSANASIVDYTITLTATTGLSGSGDLKIDTTKITDPNGTYLPSSNLVTNLVIDIGTSVFDLTSSFLSITLQSSAPLSITSEVFSPNFLLTGGNGYIYTGPDQIGVGTISFAVAAVPEASTWAMMILGFLGLGVMVHRKKHALRFA